MSETQAPIKLPETNCPACGVGVVAGSSRCPRCHSALSTASLDSHPRSTWLIALLALSALGAIVFLLVRSGSSTDPASPSPQPVGGPAAPGGATRSPAPPPLTATTPQGVLDELVRSAENRSLKATVEVRKAAPARVIVVSEQCGDDRLRRLLDERATALGGAGFTSLSCLSADGREQLSLSFR